jgi:hypothetical protein
MNEVSLDVVALGEAMIEFNEARGQDARSWLQGFGGDTSNMAIAAARPREGDHPRDVAHGRLGAAGPRRCEAAVR